jgi:ribonuclease E
MLVNAAHPEECRIAIADETTLLELEVESTASVKLKGNIYKAKVVRVEPSLQAAFLDIASNRNGFLQIHDVHPSCFRRQVKRVPHSRINIQDVLAPEQELIVQVVKEERESKGATLTTYISLPGRYTVLMPGSERSGVSRKIQDLETRRRLKNLRDELQLPEGMGVIIRTAGLHRSMSELARDVSLQLKLWERIQEQAKDATCPTLLYREGELASRVIRDYFTPEIMEIIVDDEPTFHRIREFASQTMPRYRSRVKLYTHKDPIFSHYGLDEQVATTTLPEVSLPSGGSIVIEPLEALVAVDVNSGKATAGEGIEETAYRTNLEAADEIARQLRLRDLGGLVVIDFIDMNSPRHIQNVEKRLRQAVKLDKARVEVGGISKFGLLEMSRQRIRASLESQSMTKCQACQGTGKVKNPEIVALEVMRKIQAAVVQGTVELVKARLSPAPAMFLLNRKRREIAKLESEYDLMILIVADARLRADEYEFEIEESQSKSEDLSDKPTVLETDEPTEVKTTTRETAADRVRRIRENRKRKKALREEEKTADEPA